MNLQVVSKNIHITKRDLFYTDVKLFGKQEESDSVLDDIACMIGCTRTSLNVVASDKGVRESSSLFPPICFYGDYIRPFGEGGWMVWTCSCESATTRADKDENRDRWLLVELTF